MRAIAWLIVKLSGLFVKLYHLILNAIRRFDRAMRKRYRVFLDAECLSVSGCVTLWASPALLALSAPASCERSAESFA